MPIDHAKVNPKLFTIVVDGGSNHSLELNNSIIIGDGDSSHDPTVIQHKYHPEKNETDFELALKFIPSETQELHLHGFLGGRLDHMLSILGNAQNLLHHQTNINKMIFYEEESVIYLFKQQFEINHFGIFSFLSFIDQIVSILGDVKYSAENVEVKSLSGLTVSNIASGRVKIECEQSAFLICHSPQVK